jgi:hypothetical protein
MTLKPIEQQLIEMIEGLKRNNKLIEYFKGFDNHQIIDIFIRSSSCRIDLDQKIEAGYNSKKKRYFYKTEKGYASSKLDHIFNDFYRFLVYPDNNIESIVLTEKLNIVDYKYNLEYDNPERDENSILLNVSKLAELFIEAAKKNPHQEIKMLNEQIKLILQII